MASTALELEVPHEFESFRRLVPFFRDFGFAAADSEGGFASAEREERRRTIFTVTIIKRQ